MKVMVQKALNAILFKQTTSSQFCRGRSILKNQDVAKQASLVPLACYMKDNMNQQYARRSVVLLQIAKAIILKVILINALHSLTIIQSMGIQPLDTNAL